MNGAVDVLHVARERTNETTTDLIVYKNKRRLLENERMSDEPSRDVCAAPLQGA